MADSGQSDLPLVAEAEEITVSAKRLRTDRGGFLHSREIGHFCFSEDEKRVHEKMSKGTNMKETITPSQKEGTE